jgi:hypothetical protein
MYIEYYLNIVEQFKLLILHFCLQEMRAMHIKGERAKRELAELENKEKYAVRKLMEATLQKKKENEGNIFKHYSVF